MTIEIIIKHRLYRFVYAMLSIIKILLEHGGEFVAILTKIICDFHIK